MNKFLLTNKISTSYYKRLEIAINNYFIDRDDYGYKHKPSFIKNIIQTFSLENEIRPHQCCHDEKEEELESFGFSAKKNPLRDADLLKVEENLPLPLNEIFKRLFSRSPQINGQDINRFDSAVDLLFDLGDELTLLFLKNCLIDRINFGLEMSFLAAEESTDRNVLGNFSLLTGIKVFNFNDSLLFTTIIHEAAHAVCARAFRKNAHLFDELPCSIKNPFFRKGYFPYPSPSDPSSSEINPAALKFKYCVSEDAKQKLLFANMAPEPYKAIINFVNNFFVSIKRYDNDILSDIVLQEIISCYMDMRVKLLAMARQNIIPKEYVLQLLATRLPHIDAYVNTDLKKVLELRLFHFKETCDHYNIPTPKNPPHPPFSYNPLHGTLSPNRPPNLHCCPQ